MLSKQEIIVLFIFFIRQKGCLLYYLSVSITAEFNKQIVYKYKDIEQCRNSVANSFLFNQCVKNQHRYLAFVFAVDIVEIKRIYKSVLT